MDLFRGQVLVRLAFIVVLPLLIVFGAVLFVAGARWILSVLIVVAILICLHWPSDRNAGADADPTLPVQDPGSSHTAAVQQGGVGGHGLGASALAGLPAYAYEKKTSDGGDECAVCLGEMQRGEVVKQLPACMHLFHEGCIDAWLSSHAACPVCRCPVGAALPATTEVVVRPHS